MIALTQQNVNGSIFAGTSYANRLRVVIDRMSRPRPVWKHRRHRRTQCIREEDWLGVLRLDLQTAS